MHKIIHFVTQFKNSVKETYLFNETAYAGELIKTISMLLNIYFDCFSVLSKLV